MAITGKKWLQDPSSPSIECNTGIYTYSENKCKTWRKGRKKLLLELSRKNDHHIVGTTHEMRNLISSSMNQEMVSKP